MAFNKRTWKGRQGTGLNKFSINGATPVPVINQPDSVTEQGDALSAGNLNDLEDRIYDAFDDIADGTQVVGKANADASGNVITATYETKSDASDLKDAIQGNAQRIENLEVAVSGSLVQTNTDATMANTKVITNANSILPWAILKRVGAMAVAWNQLQYNGNFASSDGWINGIVSDGHIEGSANASSYWQPFNNINKPTIIQGHIYYIKAKLKAISGLASGTTTYVLRINGSSSTYNAVTKVITSIPNGTSVILEGLHTANANTSGIDVPLFWGVFNDTNNFVAQWSECIIVDLTAMNEYDSTLTDAQNIAKFRAKYPASYYPYNTGEIIPLNPSGFKVVKFNQFDEVTELGALNGNTGANYPSTDSLRSANYIPVIPSTMYYGKIPVAWMNIYYYRADKSFITGASTTKVANSTFTTHAEAYFIRLEINSGYGTTYHNDICVNISGTKDGTYEPYEASTIDTSFTSDYKYVNESCHDYSENVLVNGVMRREEHLIVGSYTFTGNETGYSSASVGRVYLSVVTQIIKIPSSRNDKANILCAGWIPIDDNHLESNSMQISVGASGHIGFCLTKTTEAGSVDALKAYLQSHETTIYFELATPSTPTLHDPIPNIPCEDGTTITAITPQTDLVNSIDVPSTIAYMTKIGG